MTSTYQDASHKTNFKDCWNNVECKGTEHKVDASAVHNETQTLNCAFSDYERSVS